MCKNTECSNNKLMYEAETFKTGIGLIGAREVYLGVAGKSTSTYVKKQQEGSACYRDFSMNAAQATL
jgi:hypothetical protein